MLKIWNSSEEPGIICKELDSDLDERDHALIMP